MKKILLNSKLKAQVIFLCETRLNIKRTMHSTIQPMKYYYLLIMCLWLLVIHSNCYHSSKSPLRFIIGSLSFIECWVLSAGLLTNCFKYFYIVLCTQYTVLISIIKLKRTTLIHLFAFLFCDMISWQNVFDKLMSWHYLLSGCLLLIKRCLKLVFQYWQWIISFSIFVQCARCRNGWIRII